MKEYQKKFINFLVREKALTFGDFVTKSGRKTPYFVNTGNFNTGSAISELGSYYAAHIVGVGLGDSDIIFGPAYKGISLAVSTSEALNRNHNKNISFSFNRKEIKDHGDTGVFVGAKPSASSKVVIVEDVITAGTTMREIVPLLNSFGVQKIEGVVISVDRSEKGTGELSAVQEAQQNLAIKIYPIVTIHDIVAHLSEPNDSGFVIDSELKDRISAYLKTYGAS